MTASTARPHSTYRSLASSRTGLGGRPGQGSGTNPEKATATATAIRPQARERRRQAVVARPISSGTAQTQ